MMSKYQHHKIEQWEGFFRLGLNCELLLKTTYVKFTKIKDARRSGIKILKM